ncbi:bifunctional NUDIX hydrolase/phosphatase PAP2 family protein [Vibrio metoecus]|uniref:bifunctional NUDIX hydrolase/phosphatase PAP2 family protein n=1 Tax=Vibrio metoecus TaxID=1481663 RepID=UPI00189F6860|nr:NUDIX domain-containing protein [Vibrio metoecus]
MLAHVRTLWLVLGFTLSLGLSFSAMSSQEEEAAYRGALCLIRGDNKLVMTQEVLTGKLSLPGGTIEAGETPQMAAQRETWQETGMVVAVGRLLGHTPTALVYECISESQVIAYAYQNGLGGYELPIWFAPDYGVETISSMLITPSYIKANQYRYSEQWESILSLFNVSTDQTVDYVTELHKAAPRFQQVELDWLNQLQYGLAQLQKSMPWLQNIILSGMLFNLPVMGLVLFPLIYWQLGKPYCYKILFAMTVTSLLCLVAQQGFSLPRPHVYQPGLELFPSYGFGFPNLPIALWSCLGVLLWHVRQEFTHRWAMRIWAGVFIWLSFASFYSGSAFLSDIAAGSLFGGLVAWHIIRLDLKPGVNVQSLLTSKPVWWGLTIACAILSIIWPQPIFTQWLAFLVTISGLVTVLKPISAELSFREVLLMIVLLLLANEVISLAVSPLNYSSLYSLIGETLRYPALILLFVLLARRRVKPSLTTPVH